MSRQGYDAIADLYAETFPDPYEFPIEAHAAAAFAERVQRDGRHGVVVDVGCGTGHVTADLAARGLDVIGIDPSTAMLAHARATYPSITFLDGDATLAPLAVSVPIVGIHARFSLIHLTPQQVSAALALWADRVDPGTPVLVAAQASDTPGRAIPFDHAVAPAWRWHPDELAEILAINGFSEEWRIVYRDPGYRFPMTQLLTHRE